MTAAVRAWIRLARASNVPSVWTNVLAGAVLGSAPGAAWAPPGAILSVLVGATLIYTGGMMLNDVVDVDADRADGLSDRPLVAGALDPARARAVAIAAIVLGSLAAALAGPGAWPWALGLGGAVVLYDLMPRRSGAARIVMGGCRAMLVLLAGAATGGTAASPALLGWALLVGGYTWQVTGLAQREHAAAGGRGARQAALLPLWLLAGGALPGPAPGPAAIACALAMTLVLHVTAARLRAVHHARPIHVMTMIAVFSLGDAWMLLRFGAWAEGAAAIACFGAMRLLHRRIPGS